VAAEVCGERVGALEPLVEGMETRAFRFRAGDRQLVVRIGWSLRAFEVDRWAAETVAARVPVPRVVALGSLPGERAFCVSEWAPGVTLEALPAAEAASLAEAVADVWRAIAATSVDSIAGEKPPPWSSALRQTLEDGRRELRGAADLLARYEALIPSCPDARELVHADFGSNNVLTDGVRITAVLDWDQATLGDSLYDVANCYFWAPHLACMEVQAAHFERTLAGLPLPAYRERIACYALRIGLEEARTNPDLSSWALDRCRQFA